jgi:hypothetical protein
MDSAVPRVCSVVAAPAAPVDPTALAAALRAVVTVAAVDFGALAVVDPVAVVLVAEASVAALVAHVDLVVEAILEVAAVIEAIGNGAPAEISQPSAIASTAVVANGVEC